MNLNFPLSDVTVRKISVTRRVNNPLFADDYWQMNQNEFAMQVEGVGTFYACNGTEAEYAVYDKSADDSVQLYLNGSVYGAILHQRQILPMHGSSFAFDKRGVMLCGESGTGKSSLTAAFSFNGSEFLTDDVTPVVFKDNIPFILALSDRIKLWDDTLKQLNLQNHELIPTAPDYEKYYLKIAKNSGDKIQLNRIYILEINGNDETTFDELSGSPKFSALHNEIYRREYLKGMPQNEKVFFGHLLDISRCVRIFRVRRPSDIHINTLMKILSQHLNSEK